MKVTFGVLFGLLLGVVGSWAVSKGSVELLSEPSASMDMQANYRLKTSGSHAPEEEVSPYSLHEIAQMESRFQQATSLHQFFVDADAEQLNEAVPGVQQVFTAQGLTTAIRIVFSRFAEVDLPQAVYQAQRLREALRHTAGRAILDARPDIVGTEQADIRRRLGLDKTSDVGIEEIQLAWQTALQQPDVMNQAFSLIPLAERWASIDPEAAFDAALDLSREMRSFVQTRVLGVWARNDPDAAWAKVADMPASNQAQQLKSSVLVAMATHNIELAWEKIAQLSPTDQSFYRSQIIVPWAQQDPEGVLSWLREQPLQSPAQNNLMMLAMGMVAEHPQFIDRLIAQLPEDSATMVQSFAFAGLVRQDPAEAERRLASITEPRQFAAAAQQLVTQWAGDKPEYASAWIAEQQTEVQAEFNATLARVWSQYDQTRAREFAQSLNPALGRDQATFAIFQRANNLAELEKIYPTFTHEETRQNAARLLMVMLQQSDPERAKLYAQEAGLDEERQKGVLQLRSGS
ncbi:MAG: hypothetical protein ACFHXK_08155 [bacterium]